MIKIVLIAGFVAALAFPAYSQQVDPNTKEFELKVNGTDVGLIGEGLGMLPYAKVAPLMQKLQVQINTQSAPKQVEPEVKKD